MPEVTTDYTDKKPQITQIKVKIISNIKIKDKYFKITIDVPKIAKVSKPGQFLNIKVSDSYEPLLRRPFSIHRVNGGQIEILYEVVGQGTQILSQKKTGEYLDVIGPLGNGFDYRLPIADYRLPILVAGGIGVAPLLFLAERLIRRTTNDERRTTVLIGAKTKNQILCEKEFKELGCSVKISTDDGSRGFKGKATDLLKHLLWTMPACPDNRYTKVGACRQGRDYGLWTIYACGPRLMLKEISLISQQHKIPTQVSLEEHMACGIGACLGCVIKIKNQKSKIKNRFEYQRVCKEGPVFSAQEIIWE